MPTRSIDRSIDRILTTCESQEGNNQHLKQQISSNRRNTARMAASAALALRTVTTPVRSNSTGQHTHTIASQEMTTFFRSYPNRRVQQMMSSPRHSSIALLPRAQAGGPSSSSEEEEEEKEQVATTSTANGTTDVVEKLSTEEIQRQMGEIRRAEQEREEAAQSSDSLVSGVMEEVALIQWPSFTSAFLNTLLVIGLVFGTSVVLFGVNTALTEISNTIYSHK